MTNYDVLYENGVINPDSDNYIWISNMHFFSKKKFKYYLTEIYDDMINVIPFAKMSNGDVFGWECENGIQSEIVVMCNHDDGESIVYAPDLCSAIFRRILEFTNEEEFCETESDSCISLQELRKSILTYIDVFKPYFKKEYISILEELSRKPLKKVDDGCGYEYYALLSNDDLEDIINSSIYYTRLNEEFNCFDG